MSIMKKTKEFFGLQPYEMDRDEAYFAEDAGFDGNAAYAPRYNEYEPASYERENRRSSYVAPTTVVPVHIRSYSDATEIGEPFRDGDAVVFDISGMDRADAKRIIDFAAGLCFALRGQMKKLDSKVFAIVPENADVSTIDLERAARLR